ncbi:methionyl-tRNA synthetase [Streptomyces sp. yr375]|uniref:class I tRNA ligase family protein n=1 Tax=Streptomyces sp. yr375 TaxID=1761906 RepID=UPI0008B23776|nr:class I tRNA ligase family protein [Streptomyces sp. yr375]SES04844.1 methionyl-tRNA synthetase [Streptomyces sp. yr375]
MIIDTYDDSVLEDAFGIDMSDIEGLGTGAGWGRVRPGHASDSHQHDETEMFVIVAGEGEFVVDGRRHPARPGTVALFEPFESHVLENTGATDVVFLTQYWRDPDRALRSAADTGRKSFGDRPVFVFSTPPTPNGDLHLGHLSGPYLGADAYTRFQRMNGARVWHLTGSDDFQSYVTAAARAEDRTPAETAAHYSAEIAETLRLMDIPLDQYTVTDTAPGYRDGLREFFSKLVSSGSVAPTPGDSLFDPETGQYLYEVDVKGGCPGCGHGTSGNICEECGEPNTVADLTDPVTSRSAATPRRGTATRFSLPLHEFKDAVADHHRLGRTPARLRELADRIFAKARLDIPVSHPSSWGVGPAEPAGEGQVIWVWPEMSHGFLHGVEALGAGLGESWRAGEPEQDWKIVHFFGYDNSFYHGVLYPVLYKLAFPDWTPDIDYHVNEFYLLEGSKFSTSRRHAIWGKEILNPDTVDAVRYFLSSTRPEGERTDFRRAAYETALRDTLVGTWQTWLNDLGVRVAKTYDGVAPDAGTWTPEQSAFLARLGGRLTALTASLGPEGFSLREAAAELTGLVEDTVRFSRREAALLAGRADWHSELRTATALELAAAKLLAHGAAPLMPRFAARLTDALGLPEPTAWPRTVELLAPGTPVNLADAVFFKLPEDAAAEPAPLPWFSEVVREILTLAPDEDLTGRTLSALGTTSLSAVTLQYKILEHLDVDVTMEELLGDLDVPALAALLAERAERAAPEGDRS